MAYDERLAERIRHVLRGRSDMTERKMFGGLAFLRYNRMCCGIVGQDLMVRVVEAEIPALMQQVHVRPMDFTGKPMRGFVYVAPAGFSTVTDLNEWIARGLRFAESPEAPRRTKTAKNDRRRKG